MSSHRSGVISGGIGFASRAVAQLLLFGVTILATRVLSIAEFGSYALASLFLVLARALFYVGPYEYLLKTESGPELFAACFKANQVLALLSAICLAGCFFIAPMVFGTLDVSYLIVSLIPSAFLVATTAWYEAVLLRSVRIRRYYFCTFIGEMGGSLAAVLLLVKGFGVYSLVVQTYVRLLILLVLYISATGRTPRLHCSQDAVGTVLAWSRSRYAAAFLNFTTAYGADMALGALLSPAATGLYRASNRIVSTLTDLFAQPLQKIAQANISAIYVNRQAIGKRWLDMMTGVGALAWTALATLAFSAAELVPLALGEKWIGAVPIVIVLCVVRSTALLDAVTTAMLVCHDRQRDMYRIQIGAAVSVLTGAIVASFWGPMAVAITVGLVAMTVSLIYGIMAIRLSGVGMAGVTEVFRTSGPPLLLVIASLAAFQFAAPPLDRLEVLAAKLLIAGLAFACGSLFVRHRLLAAVGSLGHVTRVSQA